MPKFLYCVKNAKVCVDRYKALIIDPPTVFSLNPVCVWHSQNGPFNSKPGF